MDRARFNAARSSTAGDGDVDEALGHYYRDSVQEIGGDVRRERAIREWFSERLITAGGVRGQVLREADRSGGLDNGLVEELLRTHLIRAEKRAGATWYELAHDRLVEPVRKNDEAWRDEHLSDVQKKASLWERQGRPAGLLFLGGELAAAACWAADNEESTTDVERQFLGASRKAYEAVRRERRQARWIQALAGMAMIVAALAAWQWKKAEESAREARELARAATASSLLAGGQATWGNLAALEVREPDELPTGVAWYRTSRTTTRRSPSRSWPCR